MYSVEIGCNAEDLATVMSEMREWLDAQRFEPDIFRHNVARESITIHVQFKLESKAIAFAQAFSGQLGPILFTMEPHGSRWRAEGLRNILVH